MLSTISRVALLDGPTPLQTMLRAGAHLNHPGLWIKRDDCMSLALGGNKVRSLEYWLGEALDRNCDVLVVAGATASNQCRLAAAAAAKLGLECHILYAGDERTHPNLRIAALMGPKIHFLGPVDEEERGLLAKRHMIALEAAGRRPYLIGDPVVGALGYARAAQELFDQTRDQKIELRHVIMPGSMGVTEAGMIFGAAILRQSWTFHLVSVEYQEEVLRKRIADILDDLCRLTGFVPAINMMDSVRVHMNQLGQGYGAPTEDSFHASRLFGQLEALVLEQTYVAKTFAGLIDVVTRRVILPEEGACVLHTGGVPAALA
ncbi:1-aminocyclopropane-1-carboxylate deaminase/D-cysteine desulfhydrase [Microvirga puerhi]|uniref:Pyridoxal-phosphate dependent enzyme n=1 Tax=Microvirga puerhi TaxID=2876078 RepID=A0ABS7VJM6_9HYPH|nr:pyridoxal-phosphate dependent enzyme [Microvirga puerhi]MBZ6075689.1 pyridoxal-phosphate dependent enzyme [Microvirga puerhi]